MARRNGIIFGEALADIIEGIPQTEAGWYAKAAIAYVRRGEEPAPVPKMYVGAWIAVKAELDRLLDGIAVRRENGKNGGRPRKTANSENRAEPNETETNRTEPNLTPKNQTKPRREREENINYLEGLNEGSTIPAPAPAPARDAPLDPSGYTPPPHSPLDTVEGPYAAIAATPARDLPELAAVFCGEPHNKAAIRRYAAIIRDHEQLFREVFAAFVGEIRAGMTVKHRGKAFTTRIKSAEQAANMARASLASASREGVSA